MRAIFFLIFSLGAFAHAEDMTSRVATISKAFQTIRGCPEKIWYEDYLSGTQGVLTDAATKKAWLISEKGSEVLDFSSLPPQLQYGSFGFDLLNGIRTTAVSLTQNENSPGTYGDLAFALLTHEGFHEYGQTGLWKTGPTPQRRGDPYPENWQPRFYRNQLLRSLISAFKFPHDEAKHLGEAAYWQQLYVQQAPQDAAESRYYDFMEGSANYVDHMATAYSRRGCDAPESEIYQDLIQVADTSLEISNAPSAIAPGVEYYELGLMAGLLLNRHHVSEWQRQMVEGALPVEQLLGGVAPLVPVEDEGRRDFVKKVIEDKNAKLKVVVEPFIAALVSPEAVRISAPSNWQRGSFSASRLILPKKDLPDAMLVQEMSATLVSANNSSQMVLTDQTVAKGDSICGSNQNYFSIPKSAIHLVAENVFEMSTPSVTGKVRAHVKTDSAGFLWYCLKEK